MNVTVQEYGCIEDSCGFLGASPDRIVDEYKLDEIHKTNLVGRMLEIKCTDTRKINMTSHDIREIIPIYYYPQPQIQMQCCNLDECDFFQCNIKEYISRQDFIDDTDHAEPFRSKATGHEKGVIIQLVPFGDIGNKGINNMIYNHTKFLYPKKIEMSPYECDLWVATALSLYRAQGMNLEESLTTFQECDNPSEYIVERVIYWKLIESRCTLVKRDRKWFSDNFPILKKLWDYVTFFRSNENQKKQFLKYVKFIEDTCEEEDRNDKIMKCASILYDDKNKKYSKNVDEIMSEMKKTKTSKCCDEFDGVEICD
jgi:hypothetical protein